MEHMVTCILVLISTTILQYLPRLVRIEHVPEYLMVYTDSISIRLEIYQHCNRWNVMVYFKAQERNIGKDC